MNDVTEFPRAVGDFGIRDVRDGNTPRKVMPRDILRNVTKMLQNTQNP